MISDLNRSLGSRQFLNVANERICFASCARAFKSTGLFTRFTFPGVAVYLIKIIELNYNGNALPHCYKICGMRTNSRNRKKFQRDSFIFLIIS